MRVTGSSQGEFGLAMGMYFLAYAPSQLLVGRLFDRFGVRAVVAPAALVVALGCLLFASTNNVVVLGLGRLIQGLDWFSCLSLRHLSRHDLVHAKTPWDGPGFNRSDGHSGRIFRSIPTSDSDEVMGLASPFAGLYRGGSHHRSHAVETPTQAPQLVRGVDVRRRV
ncbi:Major Facilitator Superfamily protein [Prochlorococcus marinus str. MIT 1323]|nr:Major Facilitator Superfamily protein [Prochlorococcus marinus str. MIT 1323]